MPFVLFTGPVPLHRNTALSPKSFSRINDIMSISATDQAALATLQATAAAYLKAEVASGKVAVAAGSTTPNPYGSLSGVFANTDVIDTQLYISVDPSKLPAGQTITGVPGGGAIALAQAFQNATDVDPATGLREINQAGLGALSKALFGFATDGFGVSVGPGGVETNSLSLTDIENAVTSSINAFVAGGGQTDLTLNLTDDYTGVTKTGLVDQTTINNDTGAESVSSTVNISISAATGIVTGINDRHLLLTVTGVGIQEGTAASPAINNTNARFGGFYGSGYTPYAIDQKLPSGVEWVGSTAEEYSNNNVDTYVAPTTGATTVSDASDSGSFSQTYTVDQKGLTVIDPSTTNAEIALAALKSFRAYQQSQIDDANSSSSTGQVSAVSASTGTDNASSLQLPAKVTAADGTSSVLYTRPDGSLGKFPYQDVDTIA